MAPDRPTTAAPPASEGGRNLFLDQWTFGNTRVEARPAVGVKYFLLSQYASGVEIFYATGNRDSIASANGTDKVEWEFRKGPGSNSLAIYNYKSGKYMAAAPGPNGAISWKSAPAYQWSWAADGHYDVALFNTSKQDYLIYRNYEYGDGKRHYMLDWHYHPLPDPVPPPAPVTHSFSVTMTARPPIQGFIPFYAQFPAFGINNGNLIEVTNLTVPLWFVLPNHSSEQCGESGATTYLAPGAKMTADQMTKLWGSATPSLKNGGLPFLACAQTNQSSVRVNIKWQDP